jgi:hypothetical protein
MKYKYSDNKVKRKIVSPPQSRSTLYMDIDSLNQINPLNIFSIILSKPLIVSLKISIMYLNIFIDSIQ